MTRQTWTAFVAAVAFIVAAILMVIVPVPFVSWSPGTVQNTLGAVKGQPVIKISGIQTYPTSGALDLTTVSETRPDSRLTLPEALLSYWLPNRDVLPREAIYSPGQSAAQVKTEQTENMETSQSDAVVAALRAAGQQVSTRLAVSSVTVGGPAYRKLQPGDLILTVNGTAVTDADQVGSLVRRHPAGSTVSFRVVRGKQQLSVAVKSQTAASGPVSPVVGITVGTGYQYTPDISFDLGEDIGGPSAGLVFSLAIYDKITAGALLSGRHLAGTGTITASGSVGPIGGIQEKIAGAQNDGATVFLVPADNCEDLAGVQTKMTLIKVASLPDAISALTTLNTGGGAAQLPHC